MNKALFVFLVFLPLMARSEGLLTDAVSDLGKIADDDSISRVVSDDVYRASEKIQRAALAQSLQVDALTQRIFSLERTVSEQQEIIKRYEKVVAELEIKIGQVEK